MHMASPICHSDYLWSTKQVFWWKCTNNDDSYIVGWVVACQCLAFPSYHGSLGNFIFALSNAHQEDSGVYEIIIEGTHPATRAFVYI